MQTNTIARAMRGIFLALSSVTLSIASLAEPALYKSVNYSTSIGTNGEFSRDRVLNALIDFNVEQETSTVETAITRYSVVTRSLNLSDPTALGVSLSALLNITPNTASVTPRTYTQSGRVITFDSGVPSISRIVLSPDSDLRVDVNVSDHASNDVVQATATTNLSVLAAQALQPADLAGSYSLWIFSTILVDKDSATAVVHELEEILINFSGDGFCSAESVSAASTEQSTSWPDVQNRSTLVAQRQGNAIADSCSYSTDPAASSAEIMLDFASPTGTRQLMLEVYVSEGARYLVGERISQQDRGSQTDWPSVLSVGSRVVANTTNESLSGVYLLALTGHHLAGTTVDGIGGGAETVYGARYSLIFSGSGADSMGHSTCSIVGATLAGGRRELAGTVPQTSGSLYEYSDDVAELFDGCSYRTLLDGAIELELAKGVNAPIRFRMWLADDGETLIGGALSTSADPITSTPSELVAESTSSALLGFALRANASADSPEVVDFTFPYILPIDPGVVLATSVLPSSRSVVLGSPATAFATIINAGTSDAHRCRIAAPPNSGVNVNFQLTDATTNNPVGNPNERVDISAGQSRSFVITVSSETVQQELELPLRFYCQDANDGAVFSGINTLLFSSELIQPPDIVALAATIDQDGVVKIDPASSSGVFSMATVNLGAASDVEISVDTGESVLPVTLSLCQTDSVTGRCTNPVTPSTEPVILRADTGDTPTVGIFASSSAPIELDPAVNRLFVRIKDPAGIVRGGTSVAITTGAAQ